MTKRRAVKMSVGENLGTVSQACRAMGLARGSYYRNGTQKIESKVLEKEIKTLSYKHVRYGYRRITAMLRGKGVKVNTKRVQRVRRSEGLTVIRKQRRMRRLGASTAQRRRAAKRNEVWSWDFVSDQTANGTPFRILTLIDEHTRTCLALKAGYSLRAQDVIAVVGEAMEKHGRPEHIRSDNGPEFIAQAVQQWLKEKGVGTMYITPGSPWENGHVESFHGKLRDECLNREIFGTLREAQIILDRCRKEYNEERPHSSLGYQTPSQFTSETGTRLMGAMRPQTPHRSPRQAFGGNSRTEENQQRKTEINDLELKF